MMDDRAMPEVRSTCPYCGVGCGVLLRSDGQGGISVQGDPDHPANKGRLCSKGSALAETVGLTGRLLSPVVDGAQTDWDHALGHVAEKFRATIRDHGPDSVAFYVSGQLLSEDYYVANKLMKGFIGSANIDTNSRLCMSSTVAGHKRAFGTDTVPGTYEDLEEADLIVLVGSNLAWCHPVLYQRILAARKKRGAKLVVIDPRLTASCDGADLHLPLKIGTDVALFNGLLAEIQETGQVDKRFLAHVEGFDDALEAAQSADPSITELDPDDIATFYKLWISHKKTVTIFSQGVNQSSSGVDKVNSILNCHLATGRIGKPGCGPFSVTGQPNAMGGREVGGLANMLACHLDIENPEHRSAVRNFWQAPDIPDQAGLKAVDMFRAVGEGKIKALWIIHTNPAVTMPDANAVRAAIEGCDFTVVSDITANTDTARLADVLLPAAAWGEKDGTVTNSDRTISRQRSVLPIPGEARPDWAILAEVGRRMGWEDAFNYQSPVEIFREYAALSALAGQLGKDFDISALADLSNTSYDQMEPQRWPLSAMRKGGRFFADGAFYHADGKARMIPVRHRRPESVLAPRYPFRLNTGRIRDQWHTMTRTGVSARLSAHLGEPFVELHPDDADNLGVSASDLVRLRSPQGEAIFRARITDTVRRGDLFAPIHWTGENAPSALVDQLVAPITDPISGQPESKASAVAAERVEAAWYGFAVSANRMTPSADYSAMVPSATGYRIEMAGLNPVENWEEQARALFGLPDAEMQSVIDKARGIARIAFHKDGLLVAALFVGPEPVAVMRNHLAGLPGQEGVAVLTGQAPADQPDPGAIVCSCFNVGVNTIQAAIQEQGLMSVEDIGTALQAGTNCGSCRSELAGILDLNLPKEAAE